MPKMTQRDVRRTFNSYWRDEMRRKPTLRTDKPAMREAFSFYVDDLARSGRITEHVASMVTLKE